jgi:hypothetical protein
MLKYNINELSRGNSCATDIMIIPPWLGFRDDTMAMQPILKHSAIVILEWFLLLYSPIFSITHLMTTSSWFCYREGSDIFFSIDVAFLRQWLSRSLMKVGLELRLPSTSFSVVWITLNQLWSSIGTGISAFVTNFTRSILGCINSHPMCSTFAGNFILLLKM